MKENVDVVIITALDIERNAMLKYLPQSERVVNRGRIYYRTRLFKGGDDHLNIVLLSLPHMGNINSSIAVTQAIEVWNPRFIISVGIAGGIKNDDAQLGDLIVAEQVVYYENAKKVDIDTIRRYSSQPSSMELLNYSHNLNTDEWFLNVAVNPPIELKRKPKIYFGPVLTGEKVISSKVFLDEMKKVFPKSIGIEMEGYGIALASFQSVNRPGFLLIKSICDWADNSKNDDWQQYAAHISASYTVSFLKSLIVSTFDWDRNRKQLQKKEKKIYDGKMKICLCRNLLDDWHDLADYFDIPLNHRKRFIQGRECQGIWEWLETRNKLFAITEALKFINREDLLNCFDSE